ncbi:RICIN domain-containing protein [Micromonospora auratinigra]|uniref:Ricin-type beta-trefoil lectin domain-containing protein n=1 Tax=Micromonospora auratinigra TaxID=261654 RepID=A0A1A8ZCJ4_9ACTN|nr:RICIN domain-containing protein [Micromonospora auratinigra]SBT41712.1 Ricin-type beta-trefoil lectin domain-containing protein [Micromonospora auratinigra]
MFSTPTRRALLALCVAAGTIALSPPPAAQAAGESVDVWLTTTSDAQYFVKTIQANGTAAQQWVWTAGRDLVNPQANKCLDITGNTSADGTKTQLWSCTGGANQKWTLPS